MMKSIEIKLDTADDRVRAGRLLAAALLSMAGLYLLGEFCGQLLWHALNGREGAQYVPFQSALLLSCAALVSPFHRS